MDASPEQQALEVAIAALAAKVRDLKANKADKDTIQAALEELLQKKKELAEKFPPKKEFDRKSFEDLMRRRFFYAPAFEIYGGVAGLYDYGPTGCAIMANLLAAWRNHFVLEESMLEVQCTAMTPHYVLKASGHVDRFADVMVKDVVSGDCHRADHLLEDVMDALIAKKETTPEQKEEYSKIRAQADNYTIEELHQLFQRFNVKAPVTGNDITYPVEFNMMFSTQIGPTGLLQGFLRPETAQGIFVCFKRLYEFNNGKLPFAGAQIGTAFRNEISPKSGLLRVREFTMAEIEHFVDPENKDHPKFKRVADLLVPLLPACNQVDGKPIEHWRLGDAVAKGVIANETLGYFLGRIFLFMSKLGVDPTRIRFRQHMSNEMAHYAKDCWDTEIHTSFGWIECVGCADRSCYDLEQHMKCSAQNLLASVALEKPIVENVLEPTVDKGVLGKKFKKEGKILFAYLEGLDKAGAEALQAQLEAGPVTLTIEGQSFEIDKSVVSFRAVEKKIHERKFIPGVIEPSFGIGRIIYSLLEHSYHVREGDEQRLWLKLNPLISPVKCSLLPLSNNQPDFEEALERISQSLTRAGISYRLDDSSASIGRRYARTDEIGIPFGITVDFDTKKEGTVTVRDRNTMQQIRVKVDEVASIMSSLVNETLSWEDARKTYPNVAAAADE